MTTLTVAVPTLNRVQTLQCILEDYSKLSSFENCNLLVIDDGSTDETQNLLMEFKRLIPRMSVIKHDKNLGYWFCLSQAFKFANHWLLMAEDDGRLCVDGVSKTLQQLEFFDAEVLVSPFYAENGRKIRGDYAGNLMRQWNQLRHAPGIFYNTKRIQWDIEDLGRLCVSGNQFALFYPQVVLSLRSLASNRILYTDEVVCWQEFELPSQLMTTGPHPEPYWSYKSRMKQSEGALQISKLSQFSSARQILVGIAKQLSKEAIYRLAYSLRNKELFFSKEVFLSFTICILLLVKTWNL